MATPNKGKNTAAQTPAETEPDVKPAEAAAAEALDPDAPVVVPFRGAEFTVEQATLRSARVLLAVASNRPSVMLFETLGQVDAARFIQLCKPNEGIFEVAGEFFAALNKADGRGNS